MQVIHGPLAQMSKDILAITNTNQLLIDRQSLASAFPLAPSDRTRPHPPGDHDARLLSCQVIPEAVHRDVHTGTHDVVFSAACFLSGWLYAKTRRPRQ